MKRALMVGLAVTVVFYLLFLLTELTGFGPALGLLLAVLTAILVVRMLNRRPPAPFHLYLLHLLLLDVLIFMADILPRLLFFKQPASSPPEMRLQFLIRSVIGLPLALAVLFFLWLFLRAWLTGNPSPRSTALVLIVSGILALSLLFLTRGDIILLFWSGELICAAASLWWIFPPSSAVRFRQLWFSLSILLSAVAGLLVHNWMPMGVGGLLLLCLLPFLLLQRAGCFGRVERDADQSLLPADGHWFREEGITPRESEIISLVCRGYSNRQIEEELFISIKTVKRHLANIFQKLQVSSRLQLMMRCRDRQDS